MNTLINFKTAEITSIKFFDNSFQNQIGENEFEIIKEYSSNIIINDEFIVQLSGNDDEAHRVYIPSSTELFQNNAELQDSMAESDIDIKIIEDFLENKDIENNFLFLQEASD